MPNKFCSLLLTFMTALLLTSCKTMKRNSSNLAMTNSNAKKNTELVTKQNVKPELTGKANANSTKHSVVNTKKTNEDSNANSNHATTTEDQYPNSQSGNNVTKDHPGASAMELAKIISKPAPGLQYPRNNTTTKVANNKGTANNGTAANRAATNRTATNKTDANKTDAEESVNTKESNSSTNTQDGLSDTVATVTASAEESNDSTIDSSSTTNQNNNTVQQAQDTFSSWDTEEETSNDWAKHLLSIVLIFILLAFLAYILHSKKRITELKDQNNKHLHDIRIKQEYNEHNKNKDIEKEVKRRIEKETARIKQEYQESLATKLAKQQELIAQQKEAIAELDRIKAEKDRIKAEKDRIAQELSTKNAEIEAKSASIEAKNKEINTLRANLISKSEELGQKDTEIASAKNLLAQKEESLKAKEAELKEKTEEITRIEAELARISSEIAEGEHSAFAQNQSESTQEEERVPEPVTQGSTPSADHSAEINTMRKLLVRRIESVQTIFDMQGIKKGEVLKQDEWDDLLNFLDTTDSHFVKRIQEAFPTLSKKDLELMALLRLRIPSKNIASIYGINEKSIKQKLFMYKVKVGLENDPMSLREFIESF